MNLNKKQVLVTGADGFIGSHLVECLIEEGCHVRALSYYNSFNTWGWLESLDETKAKQIEILSGDVRDRSYMRHAVKGCDVVFHLAALIAIPYSYHAPESYVQTNINGTLNVLEAVREFNVERVIITSTSEVYGTAKYVPIDEAHPLQGQSPYSATKIAADKMAESFYRSFNTPVVIARPFNAYGPRQSARAIIPSIIIQILEGKKEINLGHLSPTRDFNFVHDVAKGFIALAKSEQVIGEEVNISTGYEISIKDLALKLMEITGHSFEITQAKERLRPPLSEVERLLGSNRKILSLTDWRPQVSLDEGLRKTLEWFSIPENLSKYKVGIYNV